MVMVITMKAWNIQTTAEITLDGPKGRVLSMVVYKDTLFAGATVIVLSNFDKVLF